MVLTLLKIIISGVFFTSLLVKVPTMNDKNLEESIRVKILNYTLFGSAIALVVLISLILYNYLNKL